MRLKIGGRVNLIGLAALASMTFGLLLALMRLSSVMYADVANQARVTVESAYSIVAQYHQLETSGRMPRAQAQAAALNALRSVRYGVDGYLWVNDFEPRMVMHPMKPELNGKPLGETRDPNGKALFREAVTTARAAPAGGFVSYYWPKPGEKEPQPKVSFVKAFTPWGWVIGTGLYQSDVWRMVLDEAMYLGGLSVIGLAAMAALSWFIGRSVSRPLDQLTGRMGTLAAGETGADIPCLNRTDELGEMAHALGVFRDALAAKAESDAARARAEAEQQMVVDAVDRHLRELSDGDLTSEITEPFPPSYDALKTSYNTALKNLRELLGALTQASEGIRTGSNEIARASDDLARRTESNAASLEETSASLSQMEARLRTSAAAAGRTVDQTSQAIANVDVGRATADEAVAAMGRVSESAQGIDGVIEGLDKIAFQTRVLAMNAAVEAGRAGEAGRGFAVVADLVSALAMRSEEEAKRAREQLTATQTDIAMAVGAVQNVDGALASISGSVQQVHELVATMADDNEAQSTTITEIAGAVNMMDRTTQQNAAMVEETSAAARTLAGEVEGLAARAARFRTEPAGRHPSARRGQPSSGPAFAPSGVTIN